MKRKTKVMLGVISGLAVGGAVGYFAATTRAARKAVKAAEDIVDDSGLRLPDPSFAMELPYSDQQFAVLDELVCECGGAIVEAAPEYATLDDVGKEIQDCVVKKLYPQFPWPAVPGDHPSVTQLYTELGVLARRAVANAQICPPDQPA